MSDEYDDLLRACRVLAWLVRNENTHDDLVEIAERESLATDEELESLRRVAGLLSPGPKR